VFRGALRGRPDSHRARKDVSQDVVQDFSQDFIEESIVTQGLWIAIAVAAVLVVIAALVLGLVRYRRRRIRLSTQREPGALDRSGGYTASSGITFSQATPTAQPAERIETSGLPAVGDDATIPRDSPRRTISDVLLPEPEPEPEDAVAPEVPPVSPTAEAAQVAEADVIEASEAIEAIAPAEGRLERLRGRLAKSQNALGRSVLGLIGAGDLDEDSWQDVEDTLLVADLGPAVTTSVVTQLRSRLASANVRTEADAREVLRDVLIGELQPGMDRSIRALPHADHPAVLLIVGVNGTGKTTTVGKLARVLVADGRRVVLGAADTFRAAAADQLQTWASRVGAEVVRGAEGADPASVAFDAVDKGIQCGADVVVIDTAGRLHTKVGLMDELDKVKRVVTRRAAVDEVLLVLDATIGQNGLAQARVFADVVDITGAVLTKLDGTAKGGIVFRVQQELGVPVKLVGLGEGPDDLAPFEPAAFVDALLG
jgi:fused signal recognition particle receptor